MAHLAALGATSFALDVTDAARAAGLTKADNGRFINHDGAPLDW